MSLNQIQNKLQKLESALHADNKKRMRLGIIQHELEILRKDLLKSHSRLKKEKEDVEELERKNIKSLFVQILGSHEEQIKKERQQYLQEVLHHNSLIDEINTLEYEERILKEKVLKDRDQHILEINQAIKSKENLLFNNLEFKEEIRRYDAELKELYVRDKDIKEAIKEGKILSANMEIVKANLKKVKEWGTYRMYGKGRYSSYNKKNYIDKANKKAIIVNMYIKKFTRELKDVFPDMDINLTIEYFETFLQHFYHNLITDWVIQRKLDNAIHGISLMIDKLNRIQLLLEKEYELISKRQENAVIQRNEYVKTFK